MANPFGGTTGNPFTATVGATSGHHPHGAGGLIENFANDVKNSVIGLPAGTVQLVEHPIGGLKMMARSTWQTWSPLFHGHLGQFAHGVYEHPLAPLLDIATVFDLGLGTAGKLGALTEASDTSLLGKAAKLRENKSETLVDPLGKRHDQQFNYSTRPLRRLVQEHVTPRVVEHLPAGMQAGYQQTRFERAFFTHMTHRVAAKSVAMTAMMKAGQALTDPSTAPTLRAGLAARAWTNLYQHAPVKLAPDEAVKYLQTHTHYRPVKDSSLMDPTYGKRVSVLRSKEARAQKLVANHAETAHALPSIEAELAHQNALLKDMRDNGVHIVMPAKTGRREPTDRQLMERNAAPLVEVQQNIKRLERQLGKARTSKLIHSKASDMLGTLTAQRMDAETRSFREHFAHVGASEELFSNYAQHLGRKATVGISGTMTKGKAERAVARAAVGQDGLVRLVPKHDATLLGHELHNSTGFVKWLYRKPTNAWKMAQVGYSPRTVVNNSVGNMAIYMAREDPVSGAWGMLNALKIVHGDARAGEAIMHGTAFKREHWMFRHFKTELGNVFGNELMDQTGRLKHVKSGFYPLVHKVADEPIRMAAISAYLKRDPAIKALMKERNITFDQAAGRALRKDPLLVQRAAEHARAIAGDYQTLRPWEERLRNIAPFYMWDRHIVRSTKNLVADSPARAVVGSQVSQMGKAKTQQLLGDLPEFMQGALPLSMLGLDHKTGDRASILLTNSLNPFASIGELAGTAQGLTAGHLAEPGTLAASVNPLLTGTAEYVTGQNLLTGAPKDRHGGLVTSIGTNLVEGLPGFRLAQGSQATPTTLTAKGKPKMYAVDHESSATSFLGVPIRNVSKSAAAAAAQKEKGVKKGRRRSSSPFK